MLWGIVLEMGIQISCDSIIKLHARERAVSLFYFFKG